MLGTSLISARVVPLCSNGCHLVGEVKCYSCMVPSSPGTGSQGGIAMVGATRALGNTEEGLIRGGGC